MTRTALISSLLLAVSVFAAPPAAPPPPPPPTPAAEPVVSEAAPLGEMGQSALGGAGLNRVRSAFIANRNLSLSLRAGFYRVPQLTLPAGTDEYRSTLVAASFSPLPWLELT